MGLVSQKVERSELEAGDHIYTWRRFFTYAHHGIYVGEDRVVHFTHHLNWSTSTSSSVKSRHTCHSSSTTSFPDCGFKKSENGVTISCLNCFLDDGSLCRYEYGVGLFTFMAKFRGGTCTTAKCDDPEAAIHRAMYLLNNNGFGEYNLFKHNCEDFALYCKTERLVSPKQNAVGGSGQISYVFGGFTTPLRYFSNFGIRGDVEQVKVECLAGFLGNK